MYCLTRFLAVLALGLLAAQASRAEVRFGNHVYIGGHNVSHQTFNRHRRGEYYLYDRKPRHSGCIWRKNADGSQTKVCRFKKQR